MDPQQARARVALASIGRELADGAHALVGAVADPCDPLDRIAAARMLQLIAGEARAAAVHIAAADGAPWEAIAVAVGYVRPGMTPAVAAAAVLECRRAYALPDDADGDPVGAEHDLTAGGDLVGAAAALDAWYERHRDDVEVGTVHEPQAPVQAALAGPPSE